MIAPLLVGGGMVVLAASTRCDLESLGNADGSRWSCRHPRRGGGRGKTPDGGGVGSRRGPDSPRLRLC